MEKKLADQRARGGPRGRPVLMVLIGSLVLLGIYMVSLMSWTGATSPTSPQQAASEQAASPGASSARTSGVPAGNPAYPVPAAGSANTTGSAPATR